MARISALAILVVVVLCVLPAVTLASRPVHKKKPFSVIGRVYCDPCRAGFETSASTYLEGAKVQLECRHRHSQEVLYNAEAMTDATGTYKFVVDKDQQNNVCDTILVSSSHRACKMADPGRDRSRISLTSNNGMVSNERYANNMGFLMAEPMGFCGQLMKQYELTEDEV